jgi:hypothetical protein
VPIIPPVRRSGREGEGGVGSELGAVEVGVRAVRGQQVLVPATLDDPSAVDHRDLVGVSRLAGDS